MKITNFSYSEKLDNRNGWRLEDLRLANLNLIVGKNATGKTRVINLIYNLSLFMRGTQTKLTSSTWDIKFEAGDAQLTYELKINAEGLVESEKITQGGQEKLVRQAGASKIWSETKEGAEGKWTDIDPPAEKLVMHVRRDKTEHPFLELLATWANNTWRFAFAELNSTNLIGKIRQPQAAATDEDMLKDLNSLGLAPYVLESLSEESIAKVVTEMNKVGFSTQTIRAEDAQDFVPLAVKHIQFGETGLVLPIPQTELSSGLLRALSLLIVIEYLLIKRSDVDITVLIDDLDEGLDYDRANNLSKLVFEKVKNTHVQLIAATNSRAMMNGVDIEYWNILERTAGSVKAINYENAKEAFDRFNYTGLSNFDLFASDFLEKK